MFANLRWLNNLFSTRSRRTLLETMQAVPGAVGAIILEEIGLPNGDITVHRWWRTNLASFYARANRIEAFTVSGDTITEKLANDFDELLKELQRLDQPPVKSYAVPVRDGVVFFVAWGSRDEIRDITIRNPQQNTVHFRLVDFLKNNIWR